MASVAIDRQERFARRDRARSLVIVPGVMALAGIFDAVERQVVQHPAILADRRPAAEIIEQRRAHRLVDRDRLVVSRPREDRARTGRISLRPKTRLRRSPATVSSSSPSFSPKAARPCFEWRGARLSPAPASGRQARATPAASVVVSDETKVKLRPPGQNVCSKSHGPHPEARSAQAMLQKTFCGASTGLSFEAPWGPSGRKAGSRSGEDGRRSHPWRGAPKVRRLQPPGRRSCSRSAINVGPAGSHPSFRRVCALEAGMSRAANMASQPK